MKKDRNNTLFISYREPWSNPSKYYHHYEVIFSAKRWSITKNEVEHQMYVILLSHIRIQRTNYKKTWLVDTYPAESVEEQKLLVVGTEAEVWRYELNFEQGLH